MHTGWKSRGGGTGCFLPKSLGGSRLSGKIDWGGPPISGFIAFLLTSVLKFAWGGYYIYTPPSPPLCASMFGGKYLSASCTKSDMRATCICIHPIFFHFFSFAERKRGVEDSVKPVLDWCVASHLDFLISKQK